MPSKAEKGYKGNKPWEYVVAYYPPDQMRLTPSKRTHEVWQLDGTATTAGRAITKFWQEVQEIEGWGKDDIVMVGVMPLGLPPRVQEEEEEEDYE